MRYWQITTRRLSRAAQKLIMDDAWHPFASSTLSWYRVWHKKIVQRVTFDNAEEETALFPLLQEIEPLPDLASVAGFREELHIERSGETLTTKLPLGYAPVAMEAFEQTLRAHNFRLRAEQKLLYALVPLAELTRHELVSVTERQVAVRLFFQAMSAAAGDTRAIEAARDGFRRMLDQ